MSEHSPRHFEPVHTANRSMARGSLSLSELAPCTATGPVATWLPAPAGRRLPIRPRAIQVDRVAQMAGAAGRRWTQLLAETLPAASGLALLAFGFLLLVFSV